MVKIPIFPWKNFKIPILNKWDLEWSNFPMSDSESDQWNSTETPPTKKAPCFSRSENKGGSVFGRRPEMFEGFCMVLLWKTLQKHSQNTVFALENHVWEGSVSNFSRLRRLQWLKNRYLVWCTSLTVIWYGTVCVSNDLYALLLVKSAAGAKFLVLFAGFRS